MIEKISEAWLRTVEARHEESESFLKARGQQAPDCHRDRASLLAIVRQLLPQRESKLGPNRECLDPELHEVRPCDCHARAYDCGKPRPEGWTPESRSTKEDAKREQNRD